MKEAKCHKFWEQGLNPITMKRPEEDYKAPSLSEAAIQAKDEKVQASKARAKAKLRVKRVGKFW
jgi:uncharacterized protein YdaU (DUF1376 family)